MKPFAERNPVTIGAVGLITAGVLVTAALQYQNLPLLNQSRSYSAYFDDAGGLFTGAAVEVSGYAAGKVSDVTLEGPGVLVKFSIAKGINLGDRTEASIKTKSFLGSKVLDVLPRGEGQLKGAIPIERTISPYQLPDALADLSTTINGLKTDQLSGALSTLAQTFSETPEDLKRAVEGVARFTEILDSRDTELRNFIANASQAAGVLGKRAGQIFGLVNDTNSLLAQLRTQNDALDRIWVNMSHVSQQLKSFVAENRSELRPALDKLNGVLEIVDHRKSRLQEAFKKLNLYAMSLGECVSSGPFFMAYVVNLLPGQFVQPFVDAAFSDLGLDPNVLLPSQRSDPPVGQAGTPPLPVPYPRTGQGGQPRTNLPEAITGNRDPALPTQFPGRYPYRPETVIPAGPPGGPPPGPPAVTPPELQSTLQPPMPVLVPAPGEAATSPGQGG